MRIGLNLLPVVPGIGGSWYYIANLLSALAEHDRVNEYVGFVTKASAPILPATSNFTRVDLRLRAEWRPLRVLYENTIFSRVVRRHGLDVVHHLFGALPLLGTEPTVVTVCDLMAFARPQDFPAVKRSYLKLMRGRVAARGTIVSPMSHATAETLRDWMGVPSERMVVVPPSIPASYASPRADDVIAFRRRHELPEEFWLCVSGDYPHKNIVRLIDAYALLRGRERGWPLVIRGEATQVLKDRAARSGVGAGIRFLPWLEDDDMPLLYRAAGALIFPSLFEGGGLPVLEAIASSCPVVASELPTTKEFAGDAAITFDPGSITDMARAMAECESMPAERERLRRQGMRRAQLFNAASSAEACRRAYQTALASAGASR